ncbi:BspA family leucine-rich repeat surface protein [Bifidobacterium sp. ESL0763]|uniref:BspA family leucine-rich repeat surface protein n=1 Tax=Bifidobacterium sp. ESL0763 TaxID=2983227 RepID=UPI0023F6D86A|nr:BspA family leucine-rich repeat surface protein [Bifidobacterium sp. ESL0763]MDF7663372.1 BspA family leucine-rich repeat surface protein [Bifidobacterium sp. ESL0763]
MAIGLAVASAMVVGPVMASANEDASDAPAQQAAQTMTKPEAPVAAPKPSADASKGQQAKPQKPSADQQAQKATDQKADKAATAQTTQQPQAQSDPDPSIIYEGDFGGDDQGNNKVHWQLKHEGDGIVLHFGAGIYLVNASNSPTQCMIQNYEHACDAYDLPQYVDKLTGVVFDDAVHTKLSIRPRYGAGHGGNYFSFRNFPALTHIDNIGNIDFSLVAKPTSAYLGFLFDEDPALTSIDLTGWGSGRTVPGAGLPGSNANSKWKTGAEISMNEMFRNDTALTTIKGIGDWDTSAVTDMGGMFEALDSGGSNGDEETYQTPSLTSLDLSKWDVHNVTSFMQMFLNNPKLTTVGDLSNWKIGNVWQFTYMFSNTGITSLGNLSGWNVSNVHHFGGMFEDMPALVELQGIEQWNVGNAESLWSMFSGDSALTSLDLSGWDTGNASNMDEMFFDDYSLTEIKGIKDFKTGNVTTMSWMFGNDHALTSLDLSGSGWDTEKVTSMNGMFYDDYSLTEINGIKDFKTGSVTDMSWMFGNSEDDADYSSLTELDLSGSGWVTSNVENMYSMFDHQELLSEIKGIEDWDVSKVTDTAYMFNWDFALDHIDISNWDTSAVTDGTWMFPYDIQNLKLGPLTKLDASFFSDSPTEAGATESKGYTGRWAKSDDSWTSIKDQDNETFAALTQVSGFPGGTFGWQEFVTLKFDKNEPAGVNATGEANTISKVGFDVSKLTLDLPKLKSDRMERGFKGWNTERNGTGTQVPGGSYHNALRGAVDLYAQWKVPTPIDSGSISFVPVVTPTLPAQWPPASNPGGGNGGNGGQGNNGGGQGGNGPVNYYNTIYRFRVYAPTVGVAPNATDQSGIDRSVSHGKKARPKCMPASVSKRLKARKTHAVSDRVAGHVNAIEPAADNGEGHVQLATNGWKDSDYIGLPRCSAPAPEAAAVEPAATHHFNWLWLLLLLVVAVAVVVATYLYEKNKNGDESAQHRDSDSIAF